MSALHSTRVSNTCNFNTLCCCDCFSAWRKCSTKLWVLNNPCSRWLWGEGNWVGFWLRGRTGAPTCCSRPSLSCIRTCFWEGEGWRWGMRKGDGGRADNGWCNAQTRTFFFLNWLNYIFLYLTSASHSFLLMVILVMHCCWWHFCFCYYSIVCIKCCTTLMTERDQQQQKEWHENIHRNVLTDEHFYLQWNKLWNVQV